MENDGHEPDHSRRARSRRHARRAETAGASIRRISAEDAAIQLAYASKVIIVPGYGLAAAQAQHEAAELAALLQEHATVFFAIHPVAGRMPGHMNVLLAEANVPYTDLKEMDAANPEFPTADVALVVGANDVTNPAARRRRVRVRTEAPRSVRDIRRFEPNGP